jgi:hypothetical protein
MCYVFIIKYVLGDFYNRNFNICAGQHKKDVRLFCVFANSLVS